MERVHSSLFHIFHSIKFDEFLGLRLEHFFIAYRMWYLCYAIYISCTTNCLTANLIDIMSIYQPDVSTNILHNKITLILKFTNYLLQLPFTPCYKYMLCRQKISRAGNHCKMQRFYVAQEFNPAQTLEKKEYGSIMYVFLSPFFSRIKVKSRLRR